MKKSFKVLLLVLLMGGCCLGKIKLVWAITPAELLDKIQARCVDLNTLKAEFIQKTQIVTAGPLKNEEKKGVMYLKRPDKMRWDYKKEDYHIISDGNKIWFYDKKQKQVMIGKLERFFNKRLLISLFLDIKNVSRLFTMNLKEEEKGIKLMLIPKASGLNLKVITVWITKKDYQIRRVQLTDLYGNVNTLIFNKIVYNPKLKNAFFFLKTPPEVEVICLP